MARKHVLVTNDDGIGAEGLQVLETALAAMGEFRVTVVAPNDQQSASSHSLTLTSPLRILDRGPGRFSVTGTPTDSVLVALEKILVDDPPDMVLSGINHGPNMGQDVIYSGTVAAAMEGTMFGIPSYALSLAVWHPTDFSGALAAVRHYLPDILRFPLEPGTLLNINIPAGSPEEIRGVRPSRLGSRVYHDVITEQVDPRGRPYLWIAGHGPTWQEDSDSDAAAIRNGYVSVTPLVIDMTDGPTLSAMSGMARDDAPSDEKASGA